MSFLGEKTPFLLFFAFIVGFALMTLPLALVANEAEENGGKVTIDWMIAPSYRNVSVDGDQDAYDAQYNQETGLYLSELSFRVKRQSGGFDEFRVALNGFGAEPNQQVNASLFKSLLYRFDLRHFRNENISAAPDPFGQHGYQNEREFTQGILRLFPTRPFQMKLGYGQNRNRGTYGTTYHNPWDEFALNNQADWRSQDFIGEVAFREGNLGIIVNHRIRNSESDENRSLLGETSMGNNSGDLSEVRFYDGQVRQAGNEERTRATFLWAGESLDIRARYLRRENSADLQDAYREVVETNPGGGERSKRSEWTGFGQRSIKGGDLQVSIPLSKPVTLVVRLEDRQEEIRSNVNEEQTSVTFGIPTVLEVPTIRQTEIDQSRIMGGARIGPLGPWSFSADAGFRKRTIRRDWQDDLELKNDELEQSGKTIEGSLSFRKNGWSLRWSQDLRSMDEAYSASSPLEEQESKVSIAKELGRGWAASVSGSSQNRTNTTARHGVDPVFETCMRSLGFGLSHTSERVQLVANLAFLEMESKALFLESSDPLSVGFLMSDFSDATSNLFISCQINPSLRAQFALHHLNVSGDSNFKFWQVAPQLHWRIGNNKWLQIGGIHREWEGSSRYKTQEVRIGFRLGSEND